MTKSLGSKKKRYKEALWALQENGYSLDKPPSKSDYLYGYYQSASMLKEAISTYTPKNRKENKPRRKRKTSTIKRSTKIAWMPRAEWDKQTAKFYKSQQWKELRYEALRNTGAVCSCCGARASDGKRLHVDHIKPRSKYPELQYELDNLQILCEDCNVGKSNYYDDDWRVKMNH